eukprot:11759504-Alexandrium_andersonii.AAC.1
MARRVFLFAMYVRRCARDVCTDFALTLPGKVRVVVQGVAYMSLRTPLRVEAGLASECRGCGCVSVRARHDHENNSAFFIPAMRSPR